MMDIRVYVDQDDAIDYEIVDRLGYTTSHYDVQRLAAEVLEAVTVIPQRGCGSVARGYRRRRGVDVAAAAERYRHQGG